MKKYLVWMYIGTIAKGEIKSNSDFHICEAKTEKDAVLDWTRQSGIDANGMKYIGEKYEWWGRKVEVLELKDFRGEDRMVLEWVKG